MAVSLKTDLRFPESGQHGHGSRIIQIEDPSYGLDRMDYVEEMRATTGTKDSQNLEEMLKANKEMFAGGTVSEEAKDAYFRALMDAYYECKLAAKETYGRKKD